MNQLTEKPPIHADALDRRGRSPRTNRLTRRPAAQSTSAPENRPLAGPASALVDSGHDRREGQSAPRFGHFTSTSPRRPLPLAHRSVARFSKKSGSGGCSHARSSWVRVEDVDEAASQPVGLRSAGGQDATAVHSQRGRRRPRPLPWTCSRLQPLGSMGAKAASARRHLAQRRGATCGYGAIAFDNGRKSSNQE